MSTQLPMLESDDLSPADRAVLDMLREGRVTAPFVAEQQDYSLQYVRDRLGRLVEHGNARKVYEGLYELVEDPRRSDDEDDDSEPVDVDRLGFDRDLTPERREVLVAWLDHVRGVDDGVTKSDFEGWWNDQRQQQTGYGAGSFWEAFAKASMTQSEEFDKPNARTYRWVGE
jgi:hypothetical protein